MEDMEVGIGKATQLRNGNTITGNRIFVPVPVDNDTALANVDINVYSYAVKVVGNQFQYYKYNPIAAPTDEGVQSATGMGKWIYTNIGVLTRGKDKISLLQGRTGEQFGPDITRGLGVHLAEPITGSGLTVNTAKFNYIRIDDDRFNAVDDFVPGTKVDGFLLNHKFGGPGTKGGRHAAEFILEQMGQTDSTNTDRNYVGVVGFATSSTGDGGTSFADAKGAIFGGNFYGTLTPGAMYTLNVTGAEFNVGIPEGASSNIRTGLQIGGTKKKRGDVIDAAISVGNMGNACTWRTGIVFGPQNGGEVFGEDSRVISVNCQKIDRVLSLSSLAEVNHIIYHNLVKLSTKSLQLEDVGAFTSVGSPTAASTVQTIYRSSGAGSAYDARVVISGGNATDGQGNYEIKAGLMTFNCHQRPNADNQFDYGSAAYRGRTAYFGTGAINTSDDIHKPIKEIISDVLLDAWADVSWDTMFKLDDAIAIKGPDGARWHFGLIAQRVEDVFKSHGIDGFTLGLLCYDEWEYVPAVLDSTTGEEISKAIEAGSRYGIRYEEALSLEAALQRRNYKRVQERLTKLEQLVIGNTN